jgi:signal peptidase I
MSQTQNKAPAPNRRLHSPLGGLGEFEYLVCAPPASPAAVGEAQRSAAMRVPVFIFAFLALVTGCSERSFRQNGSSAMSPTIQPNEAVVADMSAFRKSVPQRWDVVVIHPPPATLAQPQEIWAMRVIGLPGESLEIREDGIYIDGKREAQPERLAGIRYVPSISPSLAPAVTYPYKIAAGTYFLVGDNTTNSFDSRFWGSLAKQSILGRVKNK